MVVWLGTKKAIVGVSIGPEHLTCSRLCNIKTNRFSVKAFRSFQSSVPLTKSIHIFNTTYLGTAIREFLDQHKLGQAYVVFSLVNPGILERIISLYEAPHKHHLQENQTTQPVIWDYMALGKRTRSGKTNYYICGIQREQLFQYQLLALCKQFNCIGIVPQRAALLKAAHAVYPNYPATDSVTSHALLQKYLNYILETIPCDSLFEKPVNTYCKKSLIEGLGLFLIGKHIYEQRG